MLTSGHVTISVDGRGRGWAPGVFVGMKKEYRFRKNVTGTAQIMLRVFNPHVYRSIKYACGL